MKYIKAKGNEKIRGLLARNEGFTLVELMVVVAIIGVLATLAVPQYQRFTAKARQSEAKIALGAMRTAIESYRPENGMTQCLRQTGYAAPVGRAY
jgi:type IV pilus assembly protein PilA